MSTDSSNNTGERLLDLPDGRTLAYSDIGDRSSSRLVIFFHGVFNVGIASRIGKELLDNHIHYVAPTLSAWGKSSPRKKGVPYHVALAADITALIQHLHPNDPELVIYVAGGSFGTVPAQMMYGAPFDIFPLGKQIAGCMLLAPFSPLRLQKDYAKSMTSATYFSIGPPSQYFVMRLLRQIVPTVMKKSISTVEGAEKFIRSQLFDKMGPAERAAYSNWREENDVQEDQLEHEFAVGMVKSVASTWEGFLETSDVIHSDWGFCPDALDAEHHTKRPIFIVSSEEDTMAPDVMAKWLTTSYKNSHSKLITGGHLAPLFQSNDLWKEFFDLCSK